MANNSDVEFGITALDDNRSFITTSHEPGREVGSEGILMLAPLLGFSVGNITEQDHSHPEGVTYPSGAPIKGDNNPTLDVGIAQRLERINPNIKFNIYTPSNNSYTPYSGSTTRDPLPEIVLPPAKRKKSN